jgi:RNA polymerase sigma-54 factor
MGLWIANSICDEGNRGKSGAKKPFPVGKPYSGSGVLFSVRSQGVEKQATLRTQGMAVELKQNLKLSQQLLMSPQIQQAIKILTLGRQELQEFIDEEIKENPCLEQVDVGTESDDQNTPQASLEELRGALEDDGALRNLESQLQLDSQSPLDERGLQDLLARFEDLNNEKTERTSLEADEIETPIYDRIRSESSDLHLELEEQLRMMHITQYEMDCAMLLLQYLSDQGFLETSLEELAQEHDIPLDDLQYALGLIQKCEPTGVGAKNLRECLLLQLAAHDHPFPGARRILEDYWPEFEKQDVPKLSKLLKIKPDEVKKVIVWIRENLDPRPARQFGSSPNQIVTPDVYIFKRGAEWVVSLNEEGLPRLKLSQRYSQMISGLMADKKDKEEKADRDFVSDKMKSAKWILQAIGQRNKTILRVAEVILSRQKEFFEQGLEHLKPLTLRAVADELGLHESTVSRTTTNKFIHTPRGLFELKYFFNTGLSGADGQELANEAIKNWVAEYIKGENPSEALSDQDISERIEKEKGIKVARRTVAKYREALGIQSSAKRRKMF